jgi:hypothetical protein
MKKAILIIALALISAVSIAQTKPQPVKKDTALIYKADPARVYQVSLTAEQLMSLVQTSQAGVVPYLKYIKLPMDKLDYAQSYFNTIVASVSEQYRKQYVADSLRTVKPLKK